jgi:hypothetical protein
MITILLWTAGICVLGVIGVVVWLLVTIQIEQDEGENPFQ